METLEHALPTSGFGPHVKTAEDWAFAYITTPSLADKTAPPPRAREFSPSRKALRVESPSRPPELQVTSRAKKAKTRGALNHLGRRAELVHRFWHHELQAAELMAWAVLAFPDTPAAFKRGLLSILDDEVRHMAMYAEYLHHAGFKLGDFPVRDWFWARVPACQSAASYCAVMGVGLEGANVDHTARFAAEFRAAGDEPGARLQEIVGEEELPHVRFGLHWLRQFTGSDDFETWRGYLPPPWSPMLMKGSALQRDMRLRAGYTDHFLTELEAWPTSGF